METPIYSGREVQKTPHASQVPLQHGASLGLALLTFDTADEARAACTAGHMLPFDQRHALQTDRLAALAARERAHSGCARARTAPVRPGLAGGRPAEIRRAFLRPSSAPGRRRSPLWAPALVRALDSAPSQFYPAEPPAAPPAAAPPGFAVGERVQCRYKGGKHHPATVAEVGAAPGEGVTFPACDFNSLCEADRPAGGSPPSADGLGARRGVHGGVARRRRRGPQPPHGGPPAAGRGAGGPAESGAPCLCPKASVFLFKWRVV